MNTLRQVTVMSAAFFLVGVGLLAASAFVTWQTSTFISASKTAPGRVVNLEWRDGTGGSRGVSGGYVTVFTFTDGSGESHTARTRSAQYPPTHQIGAAVEVLFQSDCPEDARIRSFQALWFVPTLLAAFGIAFAGVGGGGFVATRKTHGGSSQEPSTCSIGLHTLRASHGREAASLRREHLRPGPAATVGRDHEMPPIIHIKDGLLANLAAIAFLLALATLTVWLYYRGHGQVTIGVWLFAGGFVLCCYFPIGDIREPKSRLLIIEGDDLVWRIHSKEGGDVREERIPLHQIRALEFVIPKRATSRNSRLVSCAELYFVTAQGKRALPPDFFPGAYRDKIVAAIRKRIPTIQVLESSDDAA